jgi:hypothetical protein
MSDPAALSPAVAGCLDACRRCETLVDLVSRADSPVYSVIGPHLRHCTDHLRCLFRGLDSGVVDYDARDRDAALEIDPREIRRELAELGESLKRIDSAAVTRSLRVRQLSAAGAAPVVVSSNLERELVFLSGHTIHHIAIMAVLARARGIRLPEGLDMAFSSASHLDHAGS